MRATRARTNECRRREEVRKITRQLWLGDAEDACDNTTLKRVGVTAVLNVANGMYEGPDYLSFKHLKIGLLDDGSDQEIMKQLAAYTLKQLIDSGEVVLIHCGAGLSRSPYIVARYLSRRNKISLSKAYYQLKQLAPGIDENSPLI